MKGQQIPMNLAFYVIIFMLVLFAAYYFYEEGFTKLKDLLEGEWGAYTKTEEQIKKSQHIALNSVEALGFAVDVVANNGIPGAEPDGKCSSNNYEVGKPCDCHQECDSKLCINNICSAVSEPDGNCNADAEYLPDSSCDCGAECSEGKCVDYKCQSCGTEVVKCSFDNSVIRGGRWSYDYYCGINNNQGKCCKDEGLATEVCIEPPKECSTDDCCHEKYGWCYESCNGFYECSTPGSQESGCISQVDIKNRDPPFSLKQNGMTGTCRWDCESGEEDIDSNTKGGLDFCVKKDDCSVYYTQDACLEHADKCKWLAYPDQKCIALETVATAGVSFSSSSNMINFAAQPLCSGHGAVVASDNYYGCAWEKYEDDTICADCIYRNAPQDEEENYKEASKKVECEMKEPITSKINDIVDGIEQKLNNGELACCYKESAGIEQYKIIEKGFLGFQCGSGWTQLYQTKNKCIDRMKEDAYSLILPEKYLKELAVYEKELNKFGMGGAICKIIDFNLPQEITDAEEWILGAGDPLYLIYWQQFPQDEEAAWTFKWGEDGLVTFVLFAVPGGAILKPGQKAVVTSFKKLDGEVSGIFANLLKKMSGVLKKSPARSMVVVAEKTATKLERRAGLKKSFQSQLDDFGFDALPKEQKAEKILSLMGVKSTVKKYKDFVLGHPKLMASATAASILADWYDSRYEKFIPRPNSMVFKIAMDEDEVKKIGLSEKIKDFTVVLEKPDINYDKEFYLASPCHTDLEIYIGKANCDAFHKTNEMTVCTGPGGIISGDSCKTISDCTDNDGCTETCSYPSIRIKDKDHEKYNEDDNFCYSTAGASGIVALGGALVVSTAVSAALASTGIGVAAIPEIGGGIAAFGVYYYSQKVNEWPEHKWFWN